MKNCGHHHHHHHLFLLLLFFVALRHKAWPLDQWIAYQLFKKRWLSGPNPFCYPQQLLGRTVAWAIEPAFHWWGLVGQFATGHRHLPQFWIFVKSITITLEAVSLCARSPPRGGLQPWASIAIIIIIIIIIIINNNNKNHHQNHNHNNHHHRHHHHHNHPTLPPSFKSPTLSSIRSSFMIIRNWFIGHCPT